MSSSSSNEVLNEIENDQVEIVDEQTENDEVGSSFKRTSTAVPLESPTPTLSDAVVELIADGQKNADETTIIREPGEGTVHEKETLIPTPPLSPSLDREENLEPIPNDQEVELEVEMRHPIKEQDFSHIDYGLCIFSIVLFILDWAINAFVFQKFFNIQKDGEANYKVYTWLTFVFVMMCSVITAVFEIVWYRDEKVKYGHGLKWTGWIIRIFFICLLLGPAFRYIELLMYAYKHVDKEKNPKDKTKNVKRAMMMKEDADFLYMLEKFTESGLHLVLQMYIVKNELQEGEEKLIGLGEGMKIIIAIILMPYAVTCFLRSERQASDTANNMPNVGAIVQFFSRFFIIAAQALVMSMFMGSYPFIFMIITVCTWGAMAIWVFTQNTHFSRHSWLEAIYRFLIAFIYLFNYVNVREDESYYRALFYYSFMFIEKGLMVCFWSQQDHYENYYRWPVLAGFFAFFIGGIFIKIVYYECHHPTRKPSKMYKKILKYRSAPAVTTQTTISNSQNGLP